MPSKLIVSLRRLYLLIILFNFFFAFFVFADDLKLSRNKDSVYQNDRVVFSGVGGSPDGIFTFWFTNSSGEMVWAVQGVFSSSGAFQYELNIPLDWQPGDFTAFLRDYSSGFMISDGFVLNEGVIPLPRVMIELSNLRVNPSEVKLDEEVTVLVDVKNVGEVASFYTVELYVDYELVNQESVSLGVDDFTAVSFDTSSDVVGVHIVEIGGLLGGFDVVETQYPINPWVVVDLSAILIAIGGILYLRKMKML